jgi:hypothetical protein
MCALIVCDRKLPVERGRSNQVTALLREAGHDVEEVSDGALRPAPDDVVLILGNAHWFPAIRASLLDLRAGERPFVAIWHTEPLPLPGRERGAFLRRSPKEWAKVGLRDARANDPATNLRTLVSLVERGIPDLLVVGGAASHELMRRLGIQAEWLPLGYHEAHGRDLGLQRDVDVLFLGAMDVPRRRRAVRALRRRGVEVEVAGSWFDRSLWGDERTRLLNRVRVLLNISRRPGENAGVRLILGMANGALVVSEPIVDASPFVAGEHYVSAPLSEMPRVIAHYVEHEDERARLAEAGRRFATTEVTLRGSVDRLMELVERRRAPTASPRA